MKWNGEQGVAACALALALAGCGGGGDRAALVDRAPPQPAVAGVSDLPVKLGEPYKVGAITYTPEDKADYDEVGFASWYGEELTGNNTANGEAFVPDGISAAHRTLPLPSYVEVTSLDTGRTILVRVNDRGPFTGDRLIDLSQGAARQLGIAGQGHAPVRVRRVNPPEQERAALRRGTSAAERLESPVMMLTALRRKLGIAPTPPLAISARPDAAPRPTAVTPPADPAPTVALVPPPKAVAPAAKPAPARPAPAVAASGNWFVQLGAFSAKPRADALAKRAGAQVDGAGSIFRVRFGPYRSEAEAKEALRSIHAKGYPEARILSGG